MDKTLIINVDENIDLIAELAIDLANINDEFANHPAKYAWWAAMAVKAKTLVDRKKFEIDKAEDYLKKTLVGRLDAEVRTTLEMNGEKVTEGKVEKGIYAHPDYLTAQENLYNLREELLELTKSTAMLEVARESMYQRKDMLISLGAQLRAEGSNV